MYDKRAFHVDPYCKVKRSSTRFCDEPQALVNICLTCPLQKCNPTTCKRYKIAEIRWKCGVYPLVDVTVVKVVRKRCKCQDCVFGEDVGGKVFCPLVRGTCMKED